MLSGHSHTAEPHHLITKSSPCLLFFRRKIPGNSFPSVLGRTGLCTSHPPVLAERQLEVRLCCRVPSPSPLCFASLPFLLAQSRELFLQGWPSTAPFFWQPQPLGLSQAPSQGMLGTSLRVKPPRTQEAANAALMELPCHLPVGQTCDLGLSGAEL